MSGARLAALALAALTAVIAACGTEPGGAPSAPGGPPPDDGRPTDLTLARLDDTNPDPAIVEVDLEAKPGQIEYQAGKPTPTWSYNGTVPGPLIEAREGQRLIVHFKNSLPEETTIHWHGVRTPAEMDGTLLMQQPIAPGASFTYDFVLPEAGFYWYHPHMRTSDQVERGLYGAIVVRGADDVPAAAERLLVLDDVLLDGAGQPLPAGSDEEDMQGREGNTVLVNGKVLPTLAVASGTWERWRLVSAANARYFKLQLPGAELVQLGTDGGWLEAPVPIDLISLVPGERADVLVRWTGAPGANVRVTSAAHTRGHGAQTPATDVIEVRYTSRAPVDLPSPVGPSLRTIARLPEAAVTRQLRLSEEMSMDGGEMNTVFMINGESFPEVTPLVATLGDTELWEVVNETEMNHPFHLHGFFFQPLTVGDELFPLQWKDTIDVPPQQTLRLAVRYIDHAGSFPYHCHILEHAELGMVGVLEVRNP